MSYPPSLERCCSLSIRNLLRTHFLSRANGLISSSSNQEGKNCSPAERIGPKKRSSSQLHFLAQKVIKQVVNNIALTNGNMFCSANVSFSNQKKNVCDPFPACQHAKEDHTTAPNIGFRTKKTIPHLWGHVCAGSADLFPTSAALQLEAPRNKHR